MMAPEPEQQYLYLLSHGSFECYTVLGVYTDEVEAQRVADALNAEQTADERSLSLAADAQVEAIPLNPSLEAMMHERFWLRP